VDRKLTPSKLNGIFSPHSEQQKVERGVQGIGSCNLVPVSTAALIKVELPRKPNKRWSNPEGLEGL
jgi:hypothetical protein